MDFCCNGDMACIEVSEDLPACVGGPASVRDLGPHSRNFPKTFSKNLPMSDDLGIPKKFSEFSTTFFAFPKKFLFPISVN